MTRSDRIRFGRSRAGFAIAILAGILLPVSSAHSQGFTLPDGFVDEPIVGGLAQPVNLAFLPDGRALVIERATGRIRLIVSGALAAIDPVLTVDSVQTDNAERGLLGVAVDPAWPARPYVYAYYCYSGGPYARLSRYRAVGDLDFSGNGAFALDPGSRFDILSNVPDQSGNHNGGTLRFAPDGLLLLALGDDNFACNAQAFGVLSGKVLRLRVATLPDGPGANPDPALLVPADNPFAGHPEPNARLIAARGLRNPFSFAVDRETGILMIGDVGAGSFEEIDELDTLGLNFEWPLYEGPRPTFPCPAADTSRFTDPVFFYDHGEGVTVISGVLYRKPVGATVGFPTEYEGSYFLHDFYRGWIRRLIRSGDSWVTAPPVPGQPDDSTWGSGRNWVSCFEIAPDGSVWYTQNWTTYPNPDGQVRRIVRAGTTAVLPEPRDGGGIELGPALPNPTGAAVAVDLTLASDRDVRISVFDASGRRLTDLLAGRILPQGTHRVVWDGRLASGSPAPPGVYLLRIQAGSEERSIRVVRVSSGE
ncbi:MAG: PQQ-dependent sugar dehydrogenase [Candidatus Eiseniibacteriota bacterium]